MDTAISLFVGIAALGVFGFGAGFLNRSVKALAPLRSPTDAIAEKWSILTASDGGGLSQGEWERALFFVSIWIDAHLLVGAWLAFKVASKWQVWSGVVALPKELPDVDPLDYLIARREWGARTLTTFLVGTAYNIVAAVVAVAIARHWQVAWNALSGWLSSAA